MLRKLHIAIIVGIATAAWAVLLWWRGVPLKPALAEIGYFSTVVSVTFGVCVLFDRYVWPCRVRGRCILDGWLVLCPDIRGTWEVELQSSWTNPETGQSVSPIRCYYSVRQTHSTLQMHLMTRESESWLLTHSFSPSIRADAYRLIAVYTNQPGTLLRGQRSEIHQGTVDIEFHGSNKALPAFFNGEYWTDRGTKGTMKGTKKSGKIATRFEDARQLCGVDS